MTRRAFTLIELLVVFALIAILVGLLLPATCKVREASVRMRCMNNLKQIAIGVHAHADTHGYLPQATLPNPALAPDRRLSWYAAILPHVEQKALHDALDRGAAWDAPANAAAVKDRHPRIFQCFAGFNGEQFKPPGPGPFDTVLALTNYAGVAGVGEDAADMPADHPWAGAFGHDRRVKLNDIRDGAANTALVVETMADLGPWPRGGRATVRGLTPIDPATPPRARPVGGVHTGDRAGFWEDRPTGSNVALADGSVRFLRDHTAPAVWLALATTAGGEEVRLD